MVASVAWLMEPDWRRRDPRGEVTKDETFIGRAGSINRNYRDVLLIPILSVSYRICDKGYIGHIFNIFWMKNNLSVCCRTFVRCFKMCRSWLLLNCKLRLSKVNGNWTLVLDLLTWLVPFRSLVEHSPQTTSLHPALSCAAASIFLQLYLYLYLYSPHFFLQISFPSIHWSPSSSAAN